jgi:NAD+ synthase (glutamine-hydrolysing)
MKVSIAQIQPIFGDLDLNLQKHYYFTDIAIKNGANLVIFPEMSLTGYYLKDLVPLKSIGPDFFELKSLLEMSQEIDIVTSFPERSIDFNYHIASVYLHQGKIHHLHRKVYLPINGMFEDLKDFKKGNEVYAFTVGKWKMGMLICRDIWHLDTVTSLVMQGAKIIIAPSAVPLRSIGEKGPNIDLFIERTIRSYAEKGSCYFLFVNRVGFEEGICFYGGSQVADPSGKIILKMNYLEECLDFFDIQERCIEQRVSNLPLALEQENYFGKLT